MEDGLTARGADTGAGPRNGEEPSRGSARKGERALTADHILRAAIEIGDHEGLHALTMRRLAAKLGFSTMALYRHFKNKDEILDGMADLVLGNLSLPEEIGLDPETVVRDLAQALLGMMRSHPSVIYLLSTRATTSQTSLSGAFERVLERLRATGLSADLSVRVYGALMTYTMGFASYQMPRPWGGPGEDARELRRQRGHFYAALPANEFPHMVELSGLLVDLPHDSQFQVGLEFMLRGILAAHGDDVRTAEVGQQARSPR
ncbi:TetR/AcrR family transcriptional regulator [Streptosporangium sp. NPDC006013]|uniref:TetR/AcrR family transcriptional regulator n=1 Tax=Streptosporangium sp. NPDC006013 TaxID=3155596 RepID=UPI00339F280A